MARKKQKKKPKKKKTKITTPPWTPLAETRISAGIVLPAEPNIIEIDHYTFPVFAKNTIEVHIYEYALKKKYYFIEPWEDGADKAYIAARSALEYSGDVKAKSMEEWINKIVSTTVSSAALRRVVSYYLLRDVIYYGIYTPLFFDDDIIRFVIEPGNVKIKHKRHGFIELGVRTTMSDYRNLVEKLILRYGRERVIVTDQFVAAVGWGTSIGELELPSHVAITKMFTKPPEVRREAAEKLREAVLDREVILVAGPWAYDVAALVYDMVSSAHVVAVESATLPLPIRVRYGVGEVGVMLSAEQPDYVFIHPPDVSAASVASLLGVGVIMVSLAPVTKLRHIIASLPVVVVVDASDRDNPAIERYVEGEKV